MVLSWSIRQCDDAPSGDGKPDLESHGGGGDLSFALCHSQSAMHVFPGFKSIHLEAHDSICGGRGILHEKVIHQSFDGLPARHTSRGAVDFIAVHRHETLHQPGFLTLLYGTGKLFRQVINGGQAGTTAPRDKKPHHEHNQKD